jgi:hypothetical protein
VAPEPSLPFHSEISTVQVICLRLIVPSFPEFRGDPGVNLDRTPAYSPWREAVLLGRFDYADSATLRGSILRRPFKLGSA